MKQTYINLLFWSFHFHLVKNMDKRVVTVKRRRSWSRRKLTTKLKDKDWKQKLRFSAEANWVKRFLRLVRFLCTIGESGWMMDWETAVVAGGSGGLFGGCYQYVMCWFNWSFSQIQADFNVLWCFSFVMFVDQFSEVWDPSRRSMWWWQRGCRLTEEADRPLLVR